MKLLPKAALGVTAASLLTLTACGGSSGTGAASTPSGVITALTASQVATRMDIGSFKAYTASTDPNHLLGRQGEYTSKVNWSQGSIEVFSDVADAQNRETYLKAFTCPLGDGYDYLDGAALLRLDCALTPSQAQANEALFKKIMTAA